MYGFHSRFERPDARGGDQRSHIGIPVNDLHVHIYLLISIYSCTQLQAVVEHEACGPTPQCAGCKKLVPAVLTMKLTTPAMLTNAGLPDLVYHLTPV